MLTKTTTLVWNGIQPVNHFENHFEVSEVIIPSEYIGWQKHLNYSGVDTLIGVVSAFFMGKYIYLGHHFRIPCKTKDSVWECQSMIPSMIPRMWKINTPGHFKDQSQNVWPNVQGRHIYTGRRWACKKTVPIRSICSLSWKMVTENRWQPSS